LTCIELLLRSVKKHKGELRRAPTAGGHRRLEAQDSGGSARQLLVQSMEAKKVAEELADAKRGSWPAVSGVLAVVVLAVLVLSGRNAGAPVAWVQTAAASFRQGEVLFSVSALHFVSSSNVLCRGSIE